MELRFWWGGRVRAGVFLSGILGIVLACGAPQESEEVADRDRDRPDVLLVTFCTMRADRLGVYGGGELTPTIDALAREGGVFRNHYTQASFSGASFASIITGRYPFDHGIYDHPRRLGDENITLAERFHQAGYATGAFLTHPYLKPEWNYLQGLDAYNRYNLTKTKVSALQPRPVASAARQVGQALRWVSGIEDRPYFLWYQTHLSHYFPQVKIPFVSAEDMAVIKAFKKRMGKRMTPELMFAFDEQEVSAEERQALLAAYDGAIMRSDHLLGNLIAGLEEMDRFRNTIVVVTADHGETLGERGLFSNHDSNLLEPTVRVPLVVRIPGAEPLEVHSTTRSIDVVPTLGELAGLDVATALPGQSLVPLLNGEEVTLSAFSETRPRAEERQKYDRYRVRLPGIEGKIRSIRSGKYKLTVYPTEDGVALELYDLSFDPEETTNLTAELPEVAKRLATELEEWFAGYENADTAPLELDTEDLESLRSLGYID